MSLSVYYPILEQALNGSDPFLFDPLRYRVTSKHQPRVQSTIIASARPTTSNVGLLATDVVETPKEYRVYADLPGVDPQKDLEITLNNKNNVLTLKAERSYGANEGEEINENKVHYTERSYGSVQRSIRLPKNADLDGAQTHFNNGVLTVTFPKLAPVAPVGPRKLKVNVVNNNAANKSGDSNSQTDKNENNKEVASTASNEETVPPNTPAVTTEAAVEAHGAEKRENASTSANTNKTTTTSSTSPTSVAATATTAKAALGGSPIVKQSSVDGVEDVVF